ncbi:uncharacterized protein TNCV_4754951 [Trichonephila clavipes]|nr:uncharacterized protein TNCV_4754951 [Trichonephila clavipes]
MKRDSWNKLCSTLDPRFLNSKLWNLVKSISKEQLQVEKFNTILDVDGAIPQIDKDAADILGEQYQKMSNLDFSKEDGFVKRRASNIFHGCRSNSNHRNYLFATNFGMQELGAALRDTDLRKSPGPDGIHGSRIHYLGLGGRRRILDIFNIF